MVERSPESAALYRAAVDLMDDLRTLGMEEDGEFEHLLVHQFSLYSRDVGVDRLQRLQAFSQAWRERATPDRRLEVLAELRDLIVDGNVGSGALLAFVTMEDDPTVLSQAAMTLALLHEEVDRGRLEGPALVRRLAGEAEDDVQKAGLLAGLVLLGDRRLGRLLARCWRSLGFHGKEQLARVCGRCPYPATVELLLEWMAEAEGQELGEVAHALGRIPSVLDPPEVVDREWRFGDVRDPSTPNVVMEWSLPAYARRVLPRLRPIADVKSADSEGGPAVAAALATWEGATGERSRNERPDLSVRS